VFHFAAATARLVCAEVPGPITLVSRRRCLNRVSAWLAAMDQEVISVLCHAVGDARPILLAEWRPGVVALHSRAIADARLIFRA